MPNDFSDAAQKARRVTHRTIADITGDFERFHFNRAVARVRELSNALDEMDGTGAGEAWILREGLETLARLAAPMIPHIAEEMWQQLGHKTVLVDEAWPKADTALLIDDQVTIAVQVNGKLRATINLPRNVGQKDAETAALANANVQRALEGKQARRIIVVPNKIINVVA